MADLRAPILFVLDEQSSIPAYIHSYFDATDLIFSYYDDHGAQFAQDRLQQFRTLRISESNPLTHTFSGPFLTRTFQFLADSAMADFWKYLQDYAEIIPSSSDNLLFSVSQRNSQQPINVISVVQFLASVLRTVAAPPPPPPREIPKRPVDGFTFGSILPVYPSVDLIPLTASEAAKADFSNISFASRSIDSRIYPTLFSRLLPFKPSLGDRDDYFKFRRQWQSLTKMQWQRNSSMRYFVHDLEVWLKSSNFPNSRTLFNISLSMFCYRFGQLSFNHLFTLAITTILHGFMTEKDSRMVMRDERNLGDDETELCLFWPLVVLYDKLEATKIGNGEETLKVRTLLTDVSHSTLQIFEDRGIKNFDFAESVSSSLFTAGRGEEDSLMFVLSALSNGNLPFFRFNGVCVSLILLHNQFQDLRSEEINDFLNAFPMKVATIEPRLLLINIERLIGSANHK